MGKFKFTPTGMDGLTLIEPTVFGDERGYFMETFHGSEFAAAGLPADFVQDNQSRSRKGVLRGLHFQRKNPQGKLLRVVSGEVFDAAVDLRRESATFGKWYGVRLSADNKLQLYVPEGFAHGFLVLSDFAEVTYKCTRLYDQADEGGLLWNDTTVGVEWPLEGATPILSERDRLFPGLEELECF